MQLKTKSLYKQNGVGLVELMVAALLLAVGLMGFIALQYHALASANEAYDRAQAVNIARDLADRIRANPTALVDYATSLNATPATIAPCTVCATPSDMATLDAYEIHKKVKLSAMKIALNTCSGNSSRYCIYVAWKETTTTDGTAATDCTHDGNYNPTSSCMVMEAYQTLS